MTSFHEVRFPEIISYGSTGGPTRSTQVITLRSGAEQRNAFLRNSIRKYDAAQGLRSINDVHDVIKFWEARFGQLYGFRWKDWTDFKSCAPASHVLFNDQTIGTAGGGVTQFQLVKVYESGTYTYTRNIKKPVSSSVLIGVNGAQVTSGWTCDYTTGIVTFTTAPTVGTITAGYEFDVPVRFTDDNLQINYGGFEAGSIDSIAIVELLNP